jgi:hypothetical protein
MAQAVTLGPVTSEDWVQYHNVLCGICGGQIATWTGFPVSNLVSVVSIIPPVLHNRIPLIHQ